MMTRARTETTATPASAGTQAGPLEAAHAHAMKCLDALQTIGRLLHHPFNVLPRRNGWPAGPCHGADQLGEALVRLAEAWSAGINACRETRQAWASTRQARGPATFPGVHPQLSTSSGHWLTFSLAVRITGLAKVASKMASGGPGDPEIVSGWTAWAYYLVLDELGLDEHELIRLEGELLWEYDRTRPAKPAGSECDWILASEAVARLPFINNVKALYRFAEKNPDKLRLRPHPAHPQRRQAHAADVLRLEMKVDAQQFEAMDSPAADSLPDVSEEGVARLAKRAAWIRAKKRRE